ncbi:hypothetical protein [Lentzea aerocolonigenes]|uniref:hypothetical protein n=1 Tax=Lentzea aerocolonigenes TaxID=68170 RepID=UPI0012E266E9|nr:hypothetical protein [Lentzea aerocolonigenes]
MSVDVDVDESDRLGIIDALVRQRGPVAAAIQWLTFETTRSTPDPSYHQQAIPRATFGTPSAEDKVAGLRLVVGAGELDDEYRVAACAALAENKPDDAYRLFVSLQPTKLTVSYLANAGEGYVLTLLARLVQDDAQPFYIRLRACEEVECISPEFALDLYESLAQSTVLSPGQRDQVRDALEAL